MATGITYRQTSETIGSPFNWPNSNESSRDCIERSPKAMSVKDKAFGALILPEAPPPNGKKEQFSLEKCESIPGIDVFSFSRGATERGHYSTIPASLQSSEHFGMVKRRHKKRDDPKT